MAIRNYKPTSAGRRAGSVSDFSEITDKKKKPEKSLLVPLKKSGGRNNQGVITTRFRGGGHKRRYRLIDFKRKKDDVAATVVSIEYDPNRSSRIALLQYTDGTKTYILAPQGLKAGDTVMSGENVEPRVGYCLPLRKIPLGLTIHNVEMQPGRGGQICRSAGTAATLTARGEDWAQITLPSGEVRRVHNTCRATIGSIGNADHMNVSLGKAGRKRWLGRKPHNRGVSMNPVNHPMGGGEGRTAGGRHPCSPTGVLAKGGKTRKKRKPSNSSIVRRRRSGPRYTEA
ncbi:50S ribosomal protein L2 [Tuwongella immobilis]|uniref:Large ribosomal subunit protein uL2 n=1 Tax=Tuwongella immobilis TaxID=692036 RepID=A0A6C2YN29_9BACT|nr:50S ribosomal protein L2 [Tuwongella immobilis]VIP02691.1 50s ribosomal protein l2 : 50S ribosomal protein L2 OS=Singulisphaera acidiphila (strain ATCC BAA-1392 / DSM 18658 / VKM B-2454 / MOB10) GN=rplB PE=3 SV=1: Ribosomal_L2: Ribosomal_L2_C [Tuwongella immobilis]VTS02162.1 50s ribosomal protein l2 : 50S ribosomal protein L2 OS=Singulisphaera acidiphila (strain ATCC BAA-1392 / DSM 18658 / VKM B-2454 / MOB10) GN=rplB PE=3 SV=1: Ribosomal_L2: Ribosomal_L2_C [Tuwongella immobilis]